MSFICVICRDLLKISEEASSQRSSPQRQKTTCNNVSSGRRKGKSDSIVSTKCGHVYHYHCLSVWLSQNLTSDSIMRCPSCKQLIYIYELIQLFPVESNGGSTVGDTPLEQLASPGFHQKMKCAVGQLDDLIRDLGKRHSETSSPVKTNELRMLRPRDSPKKQANQLVELMKGIDSLRGSIQELSSLMEQHVEWGSVVKRQSEEITELKERNEELVLANERLTRSDDTDADVSTSEQCSSEDVVNHVDEIPCEPEITRVTSTSNSTDAAQDVSEISTETSGPQKAPSFCDTPSSSPMLTGHHIHQQRRKSVTFVDPFNDDDFNEKGVLNSDTPVGQNRDLRVGDKVVWYFEGCPEVGTVKWKGFVGSQINVGIEFERRLGLPIKDMSSDALQCIFKSKPGHGRLIPVSELRLYSKPLVSTNNCLSDKFSERCDAQFNKNGGGVKRLHMCNHQ